MDSRSGRVRIVCTLGPSTRSTETLVDLIEAGMDVARLNFSHGTAEEHLTTLRNLREAARLTGAWLAAVQDLQGPKIRVGNLSAPFIELRAGEAITITTDRIDGVPGRIPTTYAGLPGDVRAGDSLLLDDGKIRLRVAGVSGNDVRCEVVAGGKLVAHKGINIPGAVVSLPSLTQKDLQDVAFGLAHGVDYIALSFVRTADDIGALRTVIRTGGGKDRFVPIIAKIEKPQAVENIDAIIDEADGVMVARGDLGVELPPEEVPVLQKSIVRKCNDAGKPVVIATQMLESMIANETPTRAEASDVANAVMDGADAVMLSGETSVGKYPLEAVRMMEKIIRRVEEEQRAGRSFSGRAERRVRDRLDALGHAACLLAEQMNAAAIVAVTHSGQTARALSRFRPVPKVIAITDRPEVLRRLSLSWGIQGLVVDDLGGDSDRVLQAVQERLIGAGLIERGQHAVLLAGQPLLARGSTNFLKVEQIV